MSTQKYPKSMMALHHIVAILMIGVWLVGELMNKENGLMMLHKPLGALVLLFAVVRIVNRMRNMHRVPASVNTGKLRLVEKAVHGFLMLIMLGMPIGGWLTSNAHGYPVSVFGWFNLPTLIATNHELAHSLGEMHEAGAKVFLLLLILHVAGVVYHKVKSGDNIMARMLPW